MIAVVTPTPRPAHLPAPLYPAAVSVVSTIKQAMSDTHDLTQRQLGVLVALDRTMSVKDLAPLLGLQKPVVTRCVSRLIDLGLVTKRRNAGDERLLDINRTHAGSKLVANLDALANDLAQRLVDHGRIGASAPAPVPASA